MMDDKIFKQPGSLEPKDNKKFLGYKVFQKIMDKIPVKYRNLIVWISFAVVFIIWILDIVIADPLPFVDEAALTFLLYILTRYILEE